MLACLGYIVPEFVRFPGVTLQHVATPLHSFRKSISAIKGFMLPKNEGLELHNDPQLD